MERAVEARQEPTAGVDETPPPCEADAILDVTRPPAPYEVSLLYVVVAALAGLLAWPLWSLLIGPRLGVPFPVVFAIAATGGLFATIVIVEWLRRYAASRPNHPLTTAKDARAVVVAFETMRPAPRLKRLQTALARKFAPGLAIRITHSPRRATAPTAEITPIAFAFEPLPLDEAAPGFAAFRPPSGDRDAPRRDDILIWLKRNVRVNGGYGVAAWAGAMCALNAFGDFQAGRISIATCFWFLFAGLFVVTPGARSFGTQWLAIPAGLVIWGANTFGRKATLRRFTRHDSMLLLERHAQSLWQVIVFDATRNAKTILTDDEVTVLLRAWLSPHEPPNEAHLRALVE